MTCMIRNLSHPGLGGPGEASRSRRCRKRRGMPGPRGEGRREIFEKIVFLASGESVQVSIADLVFSSQVSDRRVCCTVFCYRFGRYPLAISLLDLNLKQKRGETFVPPLSESGTPSTPSRRSRCPRRSCSLPHCQRTDWNRLQTLNQFEYHQR